MSGNEDPEKYYSISEEADSISMNNSHNATEESIYYGEVTYPNGATYKGDFMGSKRHGKGIHTSPNGAKYVGEFKDDKRNGHGTLTFSDGRKQEGNWKNGWLT